MRNGLGLAFLRTPIGRAWWLPVLFLLATTAAVNAADFAYATNSDNTITITNYTGSGGAVVIPSNIVDKAVIGIGNSAFYYCTNLTSVTIGNGVTSIGGYAFYLCTRLAGVTIPNSVTRIGDNVFDNCTSLTSVTIPDSVTSIGDRAFENCTHLTSVYFKGNAPSLDWHAFDGADNAVVYYLDGTTGWGKTFGGRPTKPYNPTGWGPRRESDVQ